MVSDEPARPDAGRARSIVQPIFDAESALWFCSDGQAPVPLLCDVGAQLTAPAVGMVSYRLVVTSSCPQCGVPGGRIDAAVAEDVAWDPESLGIDRPSVSFAVEAGCDPSAKPPASLDRQFRGLPSVVTWLRPSGPCEPPSPVMDMEGGQVAGFSVGLQVRAAAGSVVRDAALTPPPGCDRTATTAPTRPPWCPIAATAFCGTKRSRGRVTAWPALGHSRRAPLCYSPRTLPRETRLPCCGNSPSWWWRPSTTITPCS